MRRLIDQLNNEKMTLMVSCPKNCYEYAKIAWENGADAIKFHLNVHHHASGNIFGTYQEEGENLQKIIADSPVPVGIVLGEEIRKVEKELLNVLGKGFDYLSLYMQNASLSTLHQTELTKVYACDYTNTLHEIQKMESLGAEACEISVMHPESYGERLSVKDVLKYKEIIDAITIPATLPTQHKVYPEDLVILNKIGFSAIMIGAIVTGENLTEFGRVIKSFRDGIDSL